jgi:hypothetical protein
MHVHLTFSQSGKNLLRLVAIGAVTANEDEVPRTSFGQPLGCFQSETAEATGDYVGALRIDPECRISAPHGLQRWRLHHDFTDVL